jgi:ribosomal protein S12 methylthiotransferase accessory factor
MVEVAQEAPRFEAPPPIVMKGQSLRAAKQFVAGTHRCVSPEETWEFIRPRLRRAGITRVADLTGLDRVGVTTATAIRPNGRSLSNSAGKGFTKMAAIVSAAMEALELHHAEFPRLDYTVATHDELYAAGPVFEVDRMALSRSSLFKRDRPEAWVRGWDLLNGCETHLPWVSVTMVHRPKPQPSMEMAMPMTSNGLASGNHILEATCAALYEVIERDAVACQMNAEAVATYRAPLVPLESLGFPLVDELLGRFRAAGLRVVARDCTIDTEVPVYTAYLFDERTRGFGAFAGWGAHLDPEIALIRAITEAAQARVIYISGSRDDLFRLDERQARYEDNPAQVAKKTAPGLIDAPRRISEAQSSFEEDLTLLLEKLRRAGIRQVLVVDLTQDEFQIPVVRVVVPGLEGYIGHDYIGGERARAAIARGRRLLAGAIQ